ncbi:MAG: hypothetical protein GX144_06005 [Clostridiaceae bacterium]|nr:hypothetical protein [Clostridiaceae bacterium]
MRNNNALKLRLIRQGLSGEHEPGGGDQPAGRGAFMHFLTTKRSIPVMMFYDL